MSFQQRDRVGNPILCEMFFQIAQDVLRREPMFIDAAARLNRDQLFRASEIADSPRRSRGRAAEVSADLQNVPVTNRGEMINKQQHIVMQHRLAFPDFFKIATDAQTPTLEQRFLEAKYLREMVARIHYAADAALAPKRNSSNVGWNARAVVDWPIVKRGLISFWTAQCTSTSGRPNFTSWVRTVPEARSTVLQSRER